jgi:hypothetical protein
MHTLFFPLEILKEEKERYLRDYLKLDPERLEAAERAYRDVFEEEEKEEA